MKGRSNRNQSEEPSPVGGFLWAPFGVLALNRRCTQDGRYAGFTLIELLVVIAIIGLLSSVIFMNLASARVRARDARRLAEVREMTKALALETAVYGYALTGCTTAGAEIRSCTGPGTVARFSSYFDPSTPSAACAAGATAPCEYSISRADGTAGAMTDDYEICFFLEIGAGTVAAGLNKITSDGGISADCN